jgi:hypothetical protein
LLTRASIRYHWWTDDERERCRRRAIENDQGRFLSTGYLGPRWTAEDIALLGTLSDEEVARRMRRSVNAVRLKREELGIQNPAGNRRFRPIDAISLAN